eukprot:12828_1
MLSKNDALVMHDLTNICQNPNMRNTSTKGTIIRRTPRRTPTGDISMSLRSKTKEKRVQYHNLCNSYKTYANQRHNPRHKYNQNRNKRKHWDNDQENITPTKPPKKKRKKNNKWGNKAKQSNPSRVPTKQQNEQKRQEEIIEKIHVLETKINELCKSKMNWSDHRLIERYSIVKLFYVLQKRYNNEGKKYIDSKNKAYKIVNAQYNKCEG